MFYILYVHITPYYGQKLTGIVEVNGKQSWEHNLPKQLQSKAKQYPKEPGLSNMRNPTKKKKSISYSEIGSISYSEIGSCFELCTEIIQ